MTKLLTKRDRIALIIVVICFSLFGILTGRIIFGSILASGAEPAEYEILIGYVQGDMSISNFQDEILPMPTSVESIGELEQKQLSFPHHRYVVTLQDGYIVVYHVNQDSKANGQYHTTTGISVSSLPPEEHERLAKGINIYTEEALFRILEDYGS